MVELIMLIISTFVGFGGIIFGIITFVEVFINLRRKRVRRKVNDHCYWLNVLGLHESADIVWERTKADMNFIDLEF